MTKDSEKFSPWFHSVWRTTGPTRRHVNTGAYMKVQTCGDTCEGVSQRNNSPKHIVNLFTRAFPSLTVMRTEKHILPGCSWLSSKNDVFTHILDDVCELWSRCTSSVFSHTPKHMTELIYFEKKWKWFKTSLILQ
jgi:hypothetical protein